MLPIAVGAGPVAIVRKWVEKLTAPDREPLEPRRNNRKCLLPSDAEPMKSYRHTLQLPPAAAAKKCVPYLPRHSFSQGVMCCSQEVTSPSLNHNAAQQQQSSRCRSSRGGGRESKHGPSQRIWIEMHSRMCRHCADMGMRGRKLKQSAGAAKLATIIPSHSTTALRTPALILCIAPPLMHLSMAAAGHPSSCGIFRTPRCVSSCCRCARGTPDGCQGYPLSDAGSC